jgi:hypothetical protein
MRVSDKHRIDEAGLFRLTYGGRSPFWVNVYKLYILLREREEAHLAESQVAWFKNVSLNLPTAIAEYDRTGIPPPGFPKDESWNDVSTPSTSSPGTPPASPGSSG